MLCLGCIETIYRPINLICSPSSSPGSKNLDTCCRAKASRRAPCRSARWNAFSWTSGGIMEAASTEKLFQWVKWNTRRPIDWNKSSTDQCMRDALLQISLKDKQGGTLLLVDRRPGRNWLKRPSRSRRVPVSLLLSFRSLFRNWWCNNSCCHFKLKKEKNNKQERRMFAKPIRFYGDNMWHSWFSRLCC